MADRGTAVAIIHSHRLCREALMVGLALQDGLTVSLGMPSLDQVFRNPPALWPDLFLVAIHHPLQDCLVQVRRLQSIRPECKTIMLDVPDSSDAILACIEVGGASGYVLCNGSFDDLVGNIRAVMVGEALCSPRVATLAFSRISALARQTNQLLSDHAQCLTRREQGIVELIEKGLSNKEIAVHLGIEVSTVKNHVHNILDKLNLQDRHSAVRYVKENGLTAHFS
jgi:two-component system nitrate/nitrite response regulator NarL